MNSGFVIYAKDVSKLSRFYQQTLELELTEEESSHTLLTGASIEIVIHAIPGNIAENIEISNPPTLRSAGAIKPAFVVNNMDSVRKAADETGGGLKPKSTAWDFRGAIVLDGWDPEGNVVQFKQVK